MKVYIIGAVTGLDPEVVRNKFAHSELQLKNMGMVVVNPISFVPEGAQWVQAMKLCIKALVECDAVFLQRDWKESKGGMLELMIARNLDMPILTETIRRSKV